MAYYIVGLDIGSHNVRAVLFERTFRGYSIAEVRHAAIRQDDAGLSPADGAVAHAVEEVVFGLKAGQVTVVCSYPMEKASVWFLDLPFTDPKRIAQTVTFEVEDTVPFDLDDMLFTYRTLGTTDGTSQLMAALAPRKQIGRHLTNLEDLGVNPIALLLDGHAIANALPTQSSEASALIDIGHKRALVTVIRDGVVEHIQSVVGGGSVITKALMDKWGLPFEVAEHLKHHRVLPRDYVSEDVQSEGDESIDFDTVMPTGQGSPIPAEPASSESVASESEVSESAASEAGGDDDESSITTLSWRRLPVEMAELKDFEDEVTPLPFLDEDEKTPTGRINPYRVVAQPVAETEEYDEPGLQLEVGARAPERDPITEEAVDAVIRHAVLEMLRPVRGSLIAYEASSGHEIATAVLAGGSSGMPELPGAIEAELGLAAHPLQRLGMDHTELPIGERPAEYALAFALGLRGVTDGKLKETDFRREEFASSGDISRFRVLMVGFAAAVAMLFVGGALYGGWQYQQLRSELASTDQKLATLVIDALPTGTLTEDSIKENPENSLMKLMERSVEFQERARVLNVSEDRLPTSLEILREVSDHLSPGTPGNEEFLKVDIDEYQASENTVKLKGYTDSFEATGRIEAALKKSPVFSDVTQGDGGRSVGRETRRNFTFTLTLKDGTGS